MIASIYFPGAGKYYDFNTDLDLKTGDTVICDTARGPVIGKVNKMKNSSSKATKWIICRISVTEHRRRIKSLSAMRPKVACPIQMQVQAIQDIEMQSLIGGNAKCSKN
jgi:hypothetical protein